MYMNVTAEYAKGSSGGPVFNNRGDVVGLVSKTVSITYHQLPLTVEEETQNIRKMKKGEKPATHRGKPLFLGLHHQMTLKNTSPSRSILKLIEN